MPTFVELRKMIQLAAAELGAKVSGNRAKSLAAALLTQQSDYSTLTYKDTVGEEAVRRWLRDMLGIEREGVTA